MQHLSRAINDGSKWLKETAACIRDGNPTEKSRHHRHACHRLDEWTDQVAAMLDDDASENESGSERVQSEDNAVPEGE